MHWARGSALRNVHHLPAKISSCLNKKLKGLQLADASEVKLVEKSVRKATMRKARSVFAVLKTFGRFAGSASGADFPCAQRLQFHYSAPNQCVTSQSCFFPSIVHGPWLPAFSINRSIHSSDVSTQNAVDSSVANQTENCLPPTTEGQKPRLVVLGSGWAGCRLMKDVNPKFYDIVCISPRNHMVFTPLLTSTCVGTLEFRSVAESVRTIQPAIASEPNSYFFLAQCRSIDTENRQVHCQALGKDETADMVASGSFSVAYDKLVIALGAQSLTFNIPGVYENAIFLREVKDAQAIRSKLLLNLAISDVPGVTENEKRNILHCVVVGGGPTGVEFAGELSDFITGDAVKKFSHVKSYVKVTLIEAKEILSSFDVGLREYATKQLEKSGVKLAIGTVKEVHPGKLILSNGSEVSYGLLVWSTGVGPSDLVKALPFQKSPAGRIGVDNHLRLPDIDDVYAIGDCSGYVESTGKAVLPALAQVAERQGKYLAKSLNALAKQGGGRAGSVGADVDAGKPFVYRHLGSMATVGHYKALVDLRENKASKGLSLRGFGSWIIWRSAYLTRVVSWRNRLYVAINWGTTFLFGRDISRF